MKKTVILLLCSISILYAQTGADILAKYTTATGGQAAWDSVKTMHVRGQVSIPAQDMLLPFERVNTSEGHQLTRLKVAGMSYTETSYDGKQAWGTNEYMEAAYKTAEETENIKRNQGNYPYPAHNWEAKGFREEYIDTSTVQGRLTYKVRLFMTPLLVEGEEVENNSLLYIDAQSYFLIMTEAPVTVGPQKGQILRTVFSDYRSIDGLWYPFVSTLSYDDEVFQVITTEEVFINTEIGLETFQFPE